MKEIRQWIRNQLREDFNAAHYVFIASFLAVSIALNYQFGIENRGYILGVIAYETKSIWGGVLIHLGIAWSMELASYLQKF